MLSKIKELLGLGDKTDFALLKKEGAIILDVRSAGEFVCGHIPGSLNIPTDQLSTYVEKLKNKNEVIITCCESGARSASARNFLFASGFKRIYNGGSWKSLQRKL